MKDEVCPYARVDPDLSESRICELDGLSCPPVCYRNYFKCFLFNGKR